MTPAAAGTALVRASLERELEAVDERIDELRGNEGELMDDGRRRGSGDDWNEEWSAAWARRRELAEAIARLSPLERPSTIALAVDALRHRAAADRRMSRDHRGGDVRLERAALALDGLALELERSAVVDETQRLDLLDRVREHVRGGNLAAALGLLDAELAPEEVSS